MQDIDDKVAEAVQAIFKILGRSPADDEDLELFLSDRLHELLWPLINDSSRVDAQKS